MPYFGFYWLHQAELWHQAEFKGQRNSLWAHFQLRLLAVLAQSTALQRDIYCMSCAEFRNASTGHITQTKQTFKAVSFYRGM